VARERKSPNPPSAQIWREFAKHGSRELWTTCVRLHQVAGPGGRTRWPDQVAGPGGRTRWPNQVAAPGGCTRWLHQVAGPGGCTRWLHQVAAPVRDRTRSIAPAVVRGPRTADRGRLVRGPWLSGHVARKSLILLGKSRPQRPRPAQRALGACFCQTICYKFV